MKMVLAKSEVSIARRYVGLWRVFEHQGSLPHSLLLKARKILACLTSFGNAD